VKKKFKIIKLPKILLSPACSALLRQIFRVFFSLCIYSYFKAKMAQSKLNDLAGKFGKGGPKGLGTGLKLLGLAAAGAYGASQSVFTGKFENFSGISHHNLFYFNILHFQLKVATERLFSTASAASKMMCSQKACISESPGFNTRLFTILGNNYDAFF